MQEDELIEWICGLELQPPIDIYSYNALLETVCEELLVHIDQTHVFSGMTHADEAAALLEQVLPCVDTIKAYLDGWFRYCQTLATTDAGRRKLLPPHLVAKLDLAYLQRRVKELQDAPQTVQHSVEWAEELVGLVSASELWKVRSSTSRKSLIREKRAKALSLKEAAADEADEADGDGGQGKPQGGHSVSAPVVAVGMPGVPYANNTFGWGHCYEPVIKLIMTHRHGFTICELGRIRHADPTIKVGASVDGIVDPHHPAAKDLAGSITEIKCVVSREIIDNDIDDDYYHQVQTQLEVCDLVFTNFIEAKIVEFATLAAASATDEGFEPECGLTLFISPAPNIGPVHTVSSPVFVRLDDAVAWYKKVNLSDLYGRPIHVSEVRYWRLKKWHHLIQLRNEQWWRDTRAYVDQFWHEFETSTDAMVASARAGQRKPAEQKCLLLL
jgi:hypothetical protein